MISRRFDLFGWCLVTGTIALNAAALYGFFLLLTSETKLAPTDLATMTGFAGLILGRLDGYAAQAIAHRYGSTAGSAKKDDTISALAGKP